MEGRKDIYQLWVQYTTKNEETYFREFVKGFVAIWESQLDLDWNHIHESAPSTNHGPSLSRLPEELLPAIAKFIFIAKERIMKNLHIPESLDETELLIRCLIIICRNVENIPLVASCDYVNHTVGIAARVIHELINDDQKIKSCGMSFLIKFCHFLECLYDPHFTWRQFLKNPSECIDSSSFQPALLHVEIVPFIYDCFQTSVAEIFPHLSIELLHVLGAAISGARSLILVLPPPNLDERRDSLDKNLDSLKQGHNALRAVCPATVNIIMSLIAHGNVCHEVRYTAIQCFTMMICILCQSPPEQRQIEVSTTLRQYQDSLKNLMSLEWKENPIESLCDAVECFKMLILQPKIVNQIQHTVVENEVIETLLSVIGESKKFAFPVQSLAVMCVNTITVILQGCPLAKEQMLATKAYDRLFENLLALCTPSRELATALLDMAVEGEPAVSRKLKDAKAFLLLVRLLVAIGQEDQHWLASSLCEACATSRVSKTLACEEGVILEICKILSQHEKLSQKAAYECIKLLEVLALHSITAYELKQVFLLLREKCRFPYHVQLLHAISVVSRRSDNTECNCYFDIQNENEGIIVPEIRKWSRTGSGFCFHCWTRLDIIEDASSTTPANYRRQLFNLSTSAGTGVEVFIRPDGCLVIAIITKKEFLTVCVSEISLLDGLWHCIDICYIPSRRPFGQTQLAISIDGSQRMNANVKSLPATDSFTYCTIGSPVQQAIKTFIEDQKSSEQGALMERSLLPSLITQMPSYFSLPLRSSTALDPNVKFIPVGMQDRVWGPAISLHGQLGLSCLFHESLTQAQIHTLYDGGPNNQPLFYVDDVPEYTELVNRLIFCYSSTASWNDLCLDLAPVNKYNGYVRAVHCHTFTVKNIINSIGGVHVLFPILENASRSEDGPDLSFVSPSVEKEFKLLEGKEDSVDSDEWEILPSSSYSDWKLEQNPVSGFLSLLRNLIAESHANQEMLLKNNGMGIIGSLLSKTKRNLVDVNVLMAVQLLIEMARDASNTHLIRALYQNILFNFKIWSRSQFHVRIGHVQYISTIIKEDRKYFRKKYGVQFFLDVIHQYYSGAELLSADDCRTIRISLLGLIKYYIQKDVNVKEIASILGFFSTVKEEILLSEVVDMMISHIESKTAKDQIFLLLFEPHAAEMLYCLLVEKSFSMNFKLKILKFLSVLLNSNRVYERSKSRLRLQDGSVILSSTIGMFPGFISMVHEQPFSVEFIGMLLDLILFSDNPGSYAGALSLLHALALAELDLKLVAARKILTLIFMKPQAAHMFSKQVGWQDCITRLLIKRPISTSDNHSGSLPDLMTFDEDTMELECSPSPSSISKISTHVTDAALVLENEIKEVAETMSNAVADNIQYAAGNISSAVASAYSVFRQKTVEMQESLEELGESAVSRLKKQRSLLSLYENSSEQEQVSMQQEEPHHSLTSLGLEFDSLSLENRSPSSSSTEDLSSPNMNESITVLAKDSISITSAQSISGATNTIDEETHGESEAMKQWKEMDAEKLVDQEEELCYLVANILFSVFWRGVEGTGKEAWKERGEVMTCINLLGLNNELYCSHLQMKLRLLEMSVQASLSDLRGTGSSASVAENAAQLMRWVYDLVVLDPSTDMSKKASTKLLDGVLGLLDALLIFQEGPVEEWTEMAKLAFGILLSCSGSEDLELCAMATAKLHALIQTRNMKDLEEGGYLLFFMNQVVQKALEANNQEHYSFLIPVMKALLEKLNTMLRLAAVLPGLPQTQSGPAFFDEFQNYSQGVQWKTFVDKKVRPLHDAYQAGLHSQVGEVMNTFWAECYEASKSAVHRRAREVADSKMRFMSQIISPFRLRQTEETARYNTLLNQIRNNEMIIDRKWRHLNAFFVGPRGAWCSRTPEERHWKLSHHENFSRMRLKLCPSLSFNPHTDASNLRDNTGWLSRMRSEEIPLSLNISSAAVRGEADEDYLPEEDLRSLSEQEKEGPESTGKEKLIISQDCELVTLMSVVRGRLEITTTQVYFYDLSPIKEDVERQDFRWALSRLREIHLRKYNLRRSALEFFLTDQTNYFVNFPAKARNKVFSRILSLRPPNLYSYSSRSPAELLQASGLTQKWVNREISNFDYLMQLNTLAGRTYNDLSQYPVFPWILADYTSEELDLLNPASFRDLSKPIGVVNPKNVPEVKSKYDSFEDPSGTIAKFHYGTHYSNSAGVLHYLVRVEPFTSLHIELQSGRFDVADRQFHSIPQTWKLLMDNPNDVKELTPEFFYFPEFLKNMNNFDLGHLQGTKEKVNDVILPNWASSPEDFIYKHRKALESEYVSAHLHEWIDLIFGYKQKGPKAVEALNVFYYCSYEGAVDLDAITNPVEREAVEGMINNFGQTPSQLLKEPHPQRLLLNEAVAKMLKAELKKANFTLFLNNLKPFPVEVSSEKDPLVFISVPRSPPRSFLQSGLPDSLISISQSGLIGSHAWHPHDRHGNKCFTFDVDQSFNYPKAQHKIPGPFHPSISLNSQLFVVSHDAKFMFTVGYWDSSLRVYSLSRNKIVSSVRRHFDVVTCVALDQCGSYLITGSKDLTCVVWDISQLNSANIVSPRAVQILYGHDREVSCVGIMTELDMAVSGSLDGTVNVHTIQEGHYIRTLHPVGVQGLNMEISFLALSSEGHIAFSANSEDTCSVHVFSVNGTSFGSKFVSGQVTGLAVAGDILVVVDNAGDLTMSRLLRLSPVFDIPLHIPIQTVVVTTGNTHLLVPLNDGKVIVLGVPTS